MVREDSGRGGKQSEAPPEKHHVGNAYTYYRKRLRFGTAQFENLWKIRNYTGHQEACGSQIRAILQAVGTPCAEGLNVESD